MARSRDARLPLPAMKAAVGAVQRTHYLEQGGLACSAWADYTDDFPLGNFQVDSLKYLKITETLCYSAYLNHSL